MPCFPTMLKSSSASCYELGISPGIKPTPCLLLRLSCDCLTGILVKRLAFAWRPSRAAALLVKDPIIPGDYMLIHSTVLSGEAGTAVITVTQPNVRVALRLPSCH